MSSHPVRDLAALFNDDTNLPRRTLARSLLLLSLAEGAAKNEKKAMARRKELVFPLPVVTWYPEAHRPRL